MPLNRTRLVAAVCLLVLLIISLASAWNTRDAMSHLGFLSSGKTALVDTSPWQTAHTLTSLAVTAEELEFAHEAERLADHEVDQAFTTALRQADTPRRPKTPEAKALAMKVDQLQAQVKNDQQRVAGLSKPGAVAASGDATADNDLDIANAQLGLDSDELADAQQDLARAVGDTRGRINQELAAHRAMIAKYNAQAARQSPADVAAAHQYGSAARRVKAALDQITRYGLLQQAMRQAQSDAKGLLSEHNRIDQQPITAAATDKASRLTALKSQSARSQLLSFFDDRIQTEQQLATIYGKWSAQVGLQHQIVIHLLLQSASIIVFILLCLLLIDWLISHFVQRPGLDQRSMRTLQVISKVSLQFIGCILILLVIFGVPSQMPAILGLATAGFTVVMQDFIVAFFGWFVLMGKNGMRVGDWVEINGVGGEVAEIGLFRTALLETGNWTDKGHPTGRRVTFINSFAIRGQYFNFSTTGQWLWDEITVSIPASDDTYLTIEAIHYAVLSETEKEAQLAEQEWKRVNHQNGLAQFTATPAVDMRPAASGIDIVVRYVTRAVDRFELRNRLYQRVIEVMHKAPKP